MIPKRIIHIYCAPDGQPQGLPLDARAAVVNASLLHPAFEHIIFDRPMMESMIETDFPEYHDVFHSISLPIQQYDLFRYLAVYRLGGFYFDLDLFLADSVLPLLQHQCVFAFEELTLSSLLREHYGIDWELANYGFGSAPGSPFLKAVIDNCVRGLKDPAWAAEMMWGIPYFYRRQFVVPTMTGPGVVSRTLATNPDLSRTVSVLFPEDVCDSRQWQRFGHLGVHLMQASWRRRDGVVLNRLARLWENQRRRRLLKESRSHGPIRLGPWISILPGSVRAQ